MLKCESIDGFAIGVAETGVLDHNNGNKPRDPALAVLVLPSTGVTEFHGLPEWIEAVRDALKGLGFDDERLPDVVAVVSDHGTTPSRTAWRSTRKDANKLRHLFKVECEARKSNGKRGWEDFESLTSHTFEIKGAAGSGTEEPHPLTQAIDALIGMLILGARPIAAASLHLFVPMQFGAVPMTAPDLDKRNDDDTLAYRALRRAALEKALDNQEKGWRVEDANTHLAYFLPHVGRLLAPKFDRLPDAAELDGCIVSLSRALPADASVTAHFKNRGAVAASLTETRLHFFGERTLAVEWRLECLHSSGKAPLWRAIADGGLNGGARSAAAWLDLSYAAQHISSAWTLGESEQYKIVTLELNLNGEAVKQKLHGSVPDAPRHGGRLPVVGVLDALMKHLLGGLETSLPGKEWPKEFDERFEVRGHDRARLVQTLVPAGPQPTQKETPAFEAAEPLAAHLAMSERYARSPIDATRQRELQDSAFDWNKSRGSRYFATEQAFAYLGFGDFAVETAAERDMPGAYRRMTLLVALNGAVIDGFSRDIEHAQADWDPIASSNVSDAKLRERYAQVQARMLKFFNGCWFETVTGAAQGRELYSLILRKSTAMREFHFLKEEIGRTERYLQLRVQEDEQELQSEHTRNTSWLQLVATIVVGMAGLAALIEGGTLGSAGAVFQPLRDLGWAREWSFEIAGAILLFVVFSMTRGYPPLPGHADQFDSPPSRTLSWLVAALLIVVGEFWLRDWLCDALPPCAALRWLIALGLGGMVALGFTTAWPSVTKIGARHPCPVLHGRSLLHPDEQRALGKSDRTALRALRRAWLVLAALIGFYVLSATLHATGVFNVAASAGSPAACAKSN